MPIGKLLYLYFFSTQYIQLDLMGRKYLETKTITTMVISVVPLSNESRPVGGKNAIQQHLVFYKNNVLYNSSE